jgi:hypothetical protein
MEYQRKRGSKKKEGEESTEKSGDSKKTRKKGGEKLPKKESKSIGERENQQKRVGSHEEMFIIGVIGKVEKKKEDRERSSNG